MIPWPIAILCAAYTIVATASAATLWRVAYGQLPQSVAWPVMWCLASTTLVVGLSFLKPWARKLAIWTSVALLLSALGAAVLAIVQASPEPLRSLTATGVAGIQLIVIRYLTRPHVKHWFRAVTG